MGKPICLGFNNNGVVVFLHGANAISIDVNIGYCYYGVTIRGKKAMIVVIINHHFHHRITLLMSSSAQAPYPEQGSKDTSHI